MKWLGFLGKDAISSNNSELPEIFPLAYSAQEFQKADILATYTKILTDVYTRTHGLPEKYDQLFWDNCVQSENNEGLITMLAQAMRDKSDLYLVYNPSTNVLRKADHVEKEIIRQDYIKQGESSAGVFISFTNYRKTDLLNIYSNLEYCILSSFNKVVNLSKAVQVKIKDLRSSVSLMDKEIAATQARDIARALGNGNDVMLDVGDDILTATPQIEPTEKAIEFLDAKRAFILGLPISYISGLQTPGIGSTGEADMRAVEHGLKLYFESIVKPTILALFGVETEFKSEDFRHMSSAIELLKTFELTSDDIISRDSKQKIIARMFDLDPRKEQREIEKQEPEEPVQPVQLPPPDEDEQDTE
jgi:hypothetical protein